LTKTLVANLRKLHGTRLESLLGSKSSAILALLATEKTFSSSGWFCRHHILEIAS